MTTWTERPQLRRPGMFGGVIAADMRRSVFDYRNEVLVAHRAAVDFVFIGDSITDMWDLETYFGGRGRRIVNRGIGGDMTPYTKRRFEADVVQLRPRYAVILIGINNTWALDAWRAADLKAPEAVDAEITADIKEMVRLAEEAGIAPVVCSLLPTGIATNKQTDRRNRLVADINRELRAFAAARGLAYVDYHSRMTGEDGLTLRDGLAEDGLHPHVLGYDIMAAALREDLAAQGIDI